MRSLTTPKPLTAPTEQADADRRGRRRHDVGVVAVADAGEDDGRGGQHPGDRKVDAARQHDDGLPDRGEAEERGELEQLKHVGDGGEARRQLRAERDEPEREEHEKDRRGGAERRGPRRADGDRACFSTPVKRASRDRAYPLARRAAADDGEQDEAVDHALIERGDVGEIEQAAGDGQDQRAHRDAEGRAAAAGKRDAADHDRGDRGENVAVPGGRGAARGDGREIHAAESCEQPREDVGDGLHIFDADATHAGGLLVAADRAKMPAEGGAKQPRPADDAKEYAGNTSHRGRKSACNGRLKGGRHTATRIGQHDKGDPLPDRHGGQRDDDRR